MTLRRSTKIWALVFAGSAAVSGVLHSSARDSGCAGLFFTNVAILSAVVLLYRGVRALFRVIVRRTALRLAFSYFLIGVVPIPLTAALLCAGAYLLSHRIIATRLRREVAAAVEAAAAAPGTPSIRVRDGVVASSDIAFLSAGTAVSWASATDLPRPVLDGDKIWFAIPAGAGKPETGSLRFVLFNDPSSGLLQRVSDSSGYEVRVSTGSGRTTAEGYQLHVGKDSRQELERSARPHRPEPERRTWKTREWLVGLFLEKPLASYGESSSSDRYVIFVGLTSPRVLYGQLFEQGAPEIGRVFWAILGALAISLFFVYLIALAIAFVLVGSIARNVNRMTRAADEIARGNFAVRVQTKSRDQIGDLARSFDGMAASIQRLLAETAEKKRLEGEIATARTIQQKLLPPPEASLAGFELLAHFQPVADIGGDYYDYLAMPDGRTAVAIGDVSGHGLPTGLLVAMAKAALTTQIESGLSGPALFVRLNDLIHRSTDSRNYMTLSLVAHNLATREIELTNAGQLGPYRISAGLVESLALPSFPLGIRERTDFPDRVIRLSPGDRLVLLTDGLVEASNGSGEPFGFERLEALLQKESDSDAARIKEAILQAVASHSGSAPPDDDRTLVILTFR
ncbi:MAG TPA: SpoIIE family protein phosphatase [Thermoanaerobaculia bacterium]